MERLDHRPGKGRVIIPTLQESVKTLGTYHGFSPSTLRQLGEDTLCNDMVRPELKFQDRFIAALGLRATKKSSEMMYKLVGYIERSAIRDVTGPNRVNGYLAAVAVQGQICKDRTLFEVVRGWACVTKLDPEKKYVQLQHRALLALGNPTTDDAIDALAFIATSKYPYQALMAFSSLCGVAGEKPARIFYHALIISKPDIRTDVLSLLGIYRPVYQPLEELVLRVSNAYSATKWSNPEEHSPLLQKLTDMAVNPRFKVGQEEEARQTILANISERLAMPHQQMAPREGGRALSDLLLIELFGSDKIIYPI